MISVYQIKPAFQKLLQPLAQWLYKHKITPNQLTLLAILWSILLGVLFVFHTQNRFFLLLIPLGLLIRMALNALDGMMARQYKMQSKLGEILNELGDVVSDIAIIFPLIFIPGINIYIIVAFTILAIINEFSGLLGKAMGGERRYDGPMGKSDRAFFVSVFCIVYYFWDDLALYANWIFGICCLMLLISTFTRLKKTLL